MKTLAHVTHEAVHKVGGIGAVLEGLLTSNSYRNSEYRTILIGPWFASAGGKHSALGPTGEVLYSTFDGTRRHPASEALDRVHRACHVGIVYGHRTYTDPHSGARVSPEIVLIDVGHMPDHPVNDFKGRLWNRFQIDSRRYEHSWEYDLYVKLAEPALAVLRALGAADPDDQCIILAHEFMGMPTALAAIMDSSGSFGSVFYAHEVSTMRRIVEKHPGHDVTFYNVMAQARQQNRFVGQVFGDQYDYYRHALVAASRHCDRIFAVGHLVARELAFMDPGFADAKIVTTYNGIPVEKISLQDKLASRERLRTYAETLLGDKPDYVFTRVTRTAISKGMWRDLRVLHVMDREFRQRNKTAVMFFLSTEVPPRSTADVRTMETWWDWPVAHREGDPDLSGGEALFYQGVQSFNARSRNIKVVYVNQFGWNREVCGERMSPEMDCLDIRRGTDVEFGQSVYEPFGIAQLEPLTFGGICVVTGVCGCAGFVEEVADGDPTPNVVIANYHDLGLQRPEEAELLKLDRHQRDQQEVKTAYQTAQEVLNRLPSDENQIKALMESGYRLASEMSWDVVAGERVLPEADAICSRLRRIRIA